jgi:hypothetical protein
MAPESSTPTGRKMAIVIAALLVIAIIGTIAAVKTLGGDSTPSSPQAGTSGTAAPGRPTSTGAAAPVQIAASAVRIVAPINERDNENDAGKMVDGDTKTKWRTQKYLGAPEFGNLEKKGPRRPRRPRQGDGGLGRPARPRRGRGRRAVVRRHPGSGQQPPGRRDDHPDLQADR